MKKTKTQNKFKINNSKDIISFLFYISNCVVICYLIFVIPTYAQEKIESDNYEIQFPNLNSGAGIPSSTNYDLDSTLGQGIAGEYSSTGYRLKAGFEYIHDQIPFTFSVSDIQKNLGNLTPQTPSTSTSTLEVSAGGAGGYIVTAAETEPLTNLNTSNTIPDTTCDASDCSHTTASVWTSSSTYGFGYNMGGDDIPTEFIDNTYFKSFADLSNTEVPQAVMSSDEVTSLSSATITYKVNVSGTQPAGTYQNIILFTAIPGY